MIPLIRMDWTLNRRLLLWLAPLLACGAALVRLGIQGTLGFSFMLAALLMLLPVLRLLQDGCEPFLCALPVSRAQLVTARYLSALGSLALGMLITLALGWSYRSLGVASWQGAALADLGVSLGMQSLLLAAGLFLYLPFLFRFGGEPGAGLFIGTLSTALVLLLALAGWQGFQDRSLALAGLILEGGAARGWAWLALVLLGLASLGLSLRAYGQQLTRPIQAWWPPLLLVATLGMVAFVASRL